jgi:hypothetical protein
MRTGSAQIYAVHFPDGAVEQQIFLGPQKKPGQVITLAGQPWRVVRVVQGGGAHDSELHLGELEGYPVLLLGSSEERGLGGFYVYHGGLPQPEEVITVEDTLTSTTRPARVIRIEHDGEFPIHATEEIATWPRGHIRSFAAAMKRPRPK